MRRTPFAATLLLALCATAGARQQTAPGGARLIDSFGGINLSDLKAVLDNFAVELQNNPAATGLIAFYAARHKYPGWPARRARFCLGYLTTTRGFDASRLSVVNGGLRDDTAFELWLVPAGAVPPVKSFDASLLMAGERTPLPFDRVIVIEHGDPYESEEGEPYPNDAYLYEYFAEVLRRDPSLRGCIIAYTSRRGARTADRRIAALAKRTLVRTQAVDITHVVALGGGRREYKTIELWLVPPGAPLPRPTPEVTRTRRRRR